MTFVPGLDLARRFYVEAVRPILDEVTPGLRHSAARLGSGSEVLGYDTPRSTDHDWGPRLQLFLTPEDLASRGAAIVDQLAHRLPVEFLGHPTSFAPADATSLGVPRLVTDGPVRHGVDVTSAADWFTSRLGFDPAAGVELLDWLATPTQRLREVVAGAVFHDGLGELRPRRAALDWYPHDVWLYVLGCQWRRIAQEEPFVGRTAEVGDHDGSRIVAARLARDAQRLGLLMRRRYPPYSKWLGSDAGPPPEPGALAEAHNALGLTQPLDPALRYFHDRPYLVIGGDRFAEALFARITDPVLAAMPRIGAVDQFVDNTAALSTPALTRAITRAALFT